MTLVPHTGLVQHPRSGPATQSGTVVGVGGIEVARHGVLSTFALGSGVAVVLYDPTVRVGGLAHVMLPSQRTTTIHGRPATYANTALPALLDAMADEGAGPATHGFLIGGATVEGGFDMGGRVSHALRSGLLGHRIPIRSEDLGGPVARTVYAELATGRIEITSPEREVLWLE